MTEPKLWASERKCHNCKHSRLAATLCTMFMVDIKNPYSTCSRWQLKERYKPKKK